MSEVSIIRLPPVSINLNEFGAIEMIAFSEFTATISIAFEENAYLLIVSGVVLVASSITLLIAPIFNFAESLGAIIFAV